METSLTKTRLQDPGTNNSSCPLTRDPWNSPDGRIADLGDFCARLAMQADLSSATSLLTKTARELLDADLVQYLAYDLEDDSLAPTGEAVHKEWPKRPAAGLAGFAVQTGKRVHLDCASLDSRYHAETDNPDGTEDARFLAEPVTGPGQVPIGVITVTRSGKAAPFSQEDTHLLVLVAQCAAPTLSHILLQNRIRALLVNRTRIAGASADVFREEALEHHIRNWDEQGCTLQTLPSWLRAIYWALLALVFFSFLGLAAAGIFRKI